MFHVQEKDPQTGGFGERRFAGSYETGTADKVHELLSAVKGLHPQGTMIHAEVSYHPDDIKAQTEKAAAEVAQSPRYSEESMPSGLGRQLAINSEAQRRVPTEARASFTA
jgi:D-serine deaminase-like pyridoxal phosphate-dependent protein